MKFRVPLLVIVAIVLGLIANDFGLWWVGYLLGGALALIVRPKVAGLVVMASWLIGLGIDAATTPLFKGAQVIAEIAGFSSSAGPVLLVLTLIIAYIEGWLPAILVYRLRAHQEVEAQ